MTISGVNQQVVNPASVSNTEASLGTQFSSALTRETRNIANSNENAPQNAQQSVLRNQKTASASQFFRNDGIRKHIIESEKSRSAAKKQKKQTSSKRRQKSDPDEDDETSDLV
ncbi:MAG: hypothetical protein AAF228_11165 [Pseudomonadota bacterium]